jgi:hypothetical protein
MQPKAFCGHSQRVRIFLKRVEPVDMRSRPNRLIDDTARHQEKLFLVFCRGFDDLHVGTMGMEPDQEIKIVRHCFCKMPGHSRHRKGGGNFVSLLLEILILRRQGLRRRVDHRTVKAALIEQVGEESFTPADVGNPTGEKMLHHPRMQQLETKLLHEQEVRQPPCFSSHIYTPSRSHS